METFRPELKVPTTSTDIRKTFGRHLADIWQIFGKHLTECLKKDEKKKAHAMTAPEFAVKNCLQIWGLMIHSRGFNGACTSVHTLES